MTTTTARRRKPGAGEAADQGADQGAGQCSAQARAVGAASGDLETRRRGDGETQPVKAGLSVSFSLRGLMEACAAWTMWRDDARRMIRESLRHTNTDAARSHYLRAARDSAANARMRLHDMRSELGFDPRRLGHFDMAKLVNAGGVA